MPLVSTIADYGLRSNDLNEANLPFLENTGY